MKNSWMSDTVFSICVSCRFNLNKTEIRLTSTSPSFWYTLIISIYLMKIRIML